MRCNFGVIAREGGRSGTPRLLDRTRLSLEYRIARSSRAMTAEVTCLLNDNNAVYYRIYAGP
jgi:hypothetical protein